MQEHEHHVWIQPLPALKDNYIWMLVDENSQAAWVVDPGDAKVVGSALKKLNLELRGILLTHHHPDHSGGIPELVSLYKNLPVYGAYNSATQYVNHPVKEGQTFACLSHPCRVLEIPGHTLDHVAFYLDKALFCGDTLFSVGCGKVFEGTAQQMLHSLNKISQLADDTQIYCGHEYTLANLKFALEVDPNNKFLLEKLADTIIISQEKGCTLPASLAQEKKVNPFLRCASAQIIAAVEKYAGKKLNDPVEVFHHLREWKNNLT